ncbi:MAG TPA: prepilin-type N-terminal cleavage/methylation domain-containing protein [Phycisphaerales bacterium]|nr:prepilin-type N-terminal cleavage/methylation domain-containing protein [Phycisphaerales bacterium]HMP37986.1 prepilin-type N-terminal cleavage/methylation domain-containing protein [Phycisphaerales bacterium]
MHLPRASRGFTLIELLLVVALLVALAAIALPTALESLERRQFESEVDELVGQLRAAQAHARLEGLVLEVRAVSTPSRGGRIESTGTSSAGGSDSGRRGSASPGPLDVVVEIRRVEPGDAIDAAPDEGFGGDSSGERRSGRIAESWARRIYRLDVVRVEAAAGDASERGLIDLDPLELGGGAGIADDLGGSPRDIRLALFLPDGSAPFGGEIRATDAAGRRASIAVNPFTGIASLREDAGLPVLLGADPEELPSEDEPPAAVDAPAPEEPKAPPLSGPAEQRGPRGGMGR